MDETDLYPPLRDWLLANGCEVHAEVRHCDIAARKGGDLVLIEMKKAINLDLLLQVVRRQRLRAAVYAAVPAPRLHDRRWRERVRLLRRLEAGLLLVHLSSSLVRVEVAFHPGPHALRKAPKETFALLKEMDGRSANLNVGGGNRRKLMTAYRESALAVALALEAAGPCAPKVLRLRGGPANTQAVLSGNPYGWFEKLGKALYGLTAEGRGALADPAHGAVVEALRRRGEYV